MEQALEIDRELRANAVSSSYDRYTQDKMLLVQQSRDEEMRRNQVRERHSYRGNKYSNVTSH
jgi:hypothetical protein